MSSIKKFSDLHHKLREMGEIKAEMLVDDLEKLSQFQLGRVKGELMTITCIMDLVECAIKYGADDGR